MGNQTLVPSQIQSVESYFLDLKNYIQFRSSMGSTTFMKTAKVNLIETINPIEIIKPYPTSSLDNSILYENNGGGSSSGVGGVITPANASDSTTSTSTQPNLNTNLPGSSSNNSNSNNNNNNPSIPVLPSTQTINSSPSIASSAYNAYKLTQQLLNRQKLREQQQLVVVKIFPKYDLSIRLDLYQSRVKEIKRTIYKRYGPTGTNCLPFSELIITDRAAFLFRQYVKYNLYDRLSTRPFLTSVEKKWVAFQLLCAVNECHSLQIVHGDIKTENVLVNSFLWVNLADFASYKPVKLSKNHPSADFNYYFDISRRRTCYLAPERFDHANEANLPQQPLNHAPVHSLIELRPPDPADFAPAMDIFSLGCVFAELFMERPLFTFAQLLAYRDKKHDPRPEILADIGGGSGSDDESICSLILSMISLDPSERLSANEYLLEQNDRAFPSYFVYLKNYMSRFVSAKLSADEIVVKLRADLPLLLKNFALNSDNECAEGVSKVNSDAFFILLSLLLASVRKVKQAANKLIAVELMATFARFLDDAVILDRIVPYYLSMLDDLASSSPPIVKVHVIDALNECLAAVQHIDAQNLNIFAELIFDTLDMLAKDESFLVRSTTAKCLAGFALTSLRYLDMSFLKSSNATGNNSADNQPVANHDDPVKLSTYDKEHAHYQYRVMEIVMQLMMNPEAGPSANGSGGDGNAVKETLIRSHIGQLCAFFGRSRTTDFLLPHMITILNEKSDWWVRAAFFDALPPVLACIGWESVGIVKSLLEQGLRDSEEFVIHRTLLSLRSMVELGLLDKSQCVHFLANHVIPLLCHPSVWIRQGAVGFVAAVCKCNKKPNSSSSTSGGLNVVDILCSVVPLLNKFLRASSTDLVQFDEPAVLFACIKKPVTRLVYDTIAQDGRADALFSYLTQRSEIRQLNIFNGGGGGVSGSVGDGGSSNSHHYLPSYIDCTDQGVQELFEYLCGQCGFVEEDEDKLLHMREFLDKQRISKLSSSLHYTNPNVVTSGTGSDDLLLTGGGIGLASAHFTGPGCIDISRQTTNRGAQSFQLRPVVASGGGGQQSEIERYADRAWYLCHDQQQKQLRTLKFRETINSSLSSSMICLASNVSKWKPRGYLVLDAREHTREINRLARNADSTYFATCSTSESCVKIWSAEAGIWDAKSGFVKSVFTYDRQPNSGATANPTTAGTAAAAVSSPTMLPPTAQIADSSSALFRPTCISFYNRNSLAILCEDYRFYVIDFNSARTQYRLYSNERLFRSNACKSLTCTCARRANAFSGAYDKTSFYYLSKRAANSTNVATNPLACQCTANYPIEMIRIDESSSTWPFASTNLYDYHSTAAVSSSNVRGLLCYSASTGGLSCIDMRSRSKAFELSRDLKRGYVTSMLTDPWYTWLALGTSVGNIELFDFRFMVPVQTLAHRSRTSVVRMCNHPKLNSRIVATYQGNNELAVWNLDEQRTPVKPELVFWGVQSVPPLCQSQMANAYISGLAACSSFGDETSTNGLVCASTDMKMRYIDLSEPARESYLISSAFNVQQSQANSAQAAAGGQATKSSEFASSITTGGGGGVGSQGGVTYELRVIEGTRVLLELDPAVAASSASANSQQQANQPSMTMAAMPALTHQSYFTHHQDAITDLALCYNMNRSQPQPLVITAGRDGCLKIWK